MKKLLTVLGLLYNKPTQTQTTINGLQIKSSYYPENRPSEQDWFKEFRVSMLYDRSAVYFG
jgi:poly-D-alanine transfer protein DltD